MNNSHSIIFSELGDRIGPPVISALLQRTWEHPELISLAAGLTDSKKLPIDLVDKALTEIKERPGNLDCLQYGTTAGRIGLREALAMHLSSLEAGDSQYFNADNIMLSTGSQQALYLSMQVLCDPGDIVFVEGPSYFVFLEGLKGQGIDARTMPMIDGGGIDLEKLDTLIGKLRAEGRLNKVKAFYLVSYFSNPSSHSIPLADKEHLGTIIKKHGMHSAIIEDAAYREMWFKQPYPASSILGIKSLEGISRLYLGSFSKSFSPGVKTGYAVSSDQSLLKKMLYVKGHQDFGSSNLNQGILEIVMQKGWYQEWVDSLHEHYSKKMEIFHEVAGAEKLAELGWKWNHPEGGMMLWMRGPEGIDTSVDSEFDQACIANGVFCVPGNLCFAEGNPKNCVRISVASLGEKRITAGLKAFIKTCREFA